MTLGKLNSKATLITSLITLVASVLILYFTAVGEVKGDVRVQASQIQQLQKQRDCDWNDLNKKFDYIIAKLDAMEKRR
jgi:hypothetical protein